MLCFARRPSLGITSCLLVTINKIHRSSLSSWWTVYMKTSTGYNTASVIFFHCWPPSHSNTKQIIKLSAIWNHTVQKNISQIHCPNTCICELVQMSCHPCFITLVWTGLCNFITVTSYIRVWSNRNKNLLFYRSVRKLKVHKIIN